MPPPQHSTNVAARMGRWSARHRRTAIVGWLAFVVASVAIGAVLGTKQLDPDTIGVGESKRAQEIIEAGGFADSADESVLVASDSHTRATRHSGPCSPTSSARSRASRGVECRRRSIPTWHARLEGPARRARAVRDLGRRTSRRRRSSSPCSRASQRFRGGTRRSASRSSAARARSGRSTRRSARTSRGPSTPRSRSRSAILIVVFGALVAAGIPLLVGLSAVLAAIGLLALPSQLFAMDEAANVVVLLIGLAVGVDYSLFYLKREREERAAGKGKEAALEAAAATSGRAILISGLTVIAALAGMFFGGSQIWTSIAIGAILVVAIAVAGSLTVLPALLGWLGDRVEKGRIPLLSRGEQNARLSHLGRHPRPRPAPARPLGGARGRAAPAPRRARRSS